MSEIEKDKTFWHRLTSKQKIAGAIGAASLVAALAMGVLYSGSAEYKVLFSNVTDQDGGSIVAQLDAMKVPYKYSDSGSSILVPSEFVHSARMKLATQGLPKGGTVGFELMENQKFGISHFAEHVNYQRALEGELTKTISSIQYVSAARVHLSVPKQTVFVKEALKPSASVFLSIASGRNLERSQVAGIANLVAAAVPNMRADAVTILDQNGTHLYGGDESDVAALDARQIPYQRKIESDYVKEITSILEPIVGKGNVQAKVRAEIDFGKVEETQELFTPNSDPSKSSIRSMQSAENSNSSAPVGGVPGAVSNTPPGSGAAPESLPPGPDGKPALPPLPANLMASSSAAGPRSKTSTTNYEVDRTVRHTKRATGAVSRVSVAVLLNHRTTADEQGKPITKPLTQEELDKAKKLVQDVVGFRSDRGDSVEVANIEFVPQVKEEIPPLPFWQDPEIVSLATTVGKSLGALILALYAIFGFIRPMLRAFLADPKEAARVAAAASASGAPAAVSPDGLPREPLAGGLEASGEVTEEMLSEDFKKKKAQVSSIAKQAPDAAADVVRKWVEEGDAA